MNKRKQRQEDTRNAAKYCKTDNVTSFESGAKWADYHPDWKEGYPQIEKNKYGREEIVMTLYFYPNGIIKEKRILSSLVDPYNKTSIIRYDTNGFEIDDMPSYGDVISEKRDSHNNWTKRIFKDGREVIRAIEYY